MLVLLFHLVEIRSVCLAKNIGPQIYSSSKDQSAYDMQNLTL